MANLHFKKLDCVVLADAVSTTGKYYIFFGEHYVKGIICYDVCALVGIHAADGERNELAFRKHFLDNKTGATIEWDTFRDKMTAPRPPDQSDEPKERMITHDIS